MLGVNLIANGLILIFSLSVLFVLLQVPSFLLRYIVERLRNQRLLKREKLLETLWIEMHTERADFPEDLLLHDGQTSMPNDHHAREHEANFMHEGQTL